MSEQLQKLLKAASKVIDCDLDHFADHDAGPENVSLSVSHIDYEAHRDAMRELRQAIGRPRLRDFDRADELDGE